MKIVTQTTNTYIAFMGATKPLGTTKHQRTVQNRIFVRAS